MPLPINSAQQIITTKIDELEELDTETNCKIADLESTRRDIRAQIKILEAVLQELKIQKTPVTATNVSNQNDTLRDEADTVRPTATHAIRRLLSRSATGMTQAEIVEALKDSFETKSSNPIHILRTCLNQLKSTKKVSETDGRFKLESNFKWEGEK